MVGAGHAIERALTIREETGGVNETLWSTVDQAHQTIGATQTYALDQLDAVAKKLEATKVGGLADAAALAEHEVPKWLAVLARCFQLQDAIDVIELDRVLAESPHELDAYRRGLKKAQADRRELVSEHTAHLLARMGKAVETANAKIVWNRTKSLDVVASANDLAAGLDDFHGLLTIEANLRSWEARELGRAAEVASQAIQQSKDNGPAVVGTAALAATAVALGRSTEAATRRRRTAFVGTPPNSARIPQEIRSRPKSANVDHRAGSTFPQVKRHFREMVNTGQHPLGCSSSTTTCEAAARPVRRLCRIRGRPMICRMGAVLGARWNR